MNYLLFGGQPDTGKTSTITRLTITLTSIPFAFSIVDGVFSATSANDFLILIERINLGKSQLIIINSATDDKVCIDNLVQFIKKHNDKNIDLVISSVRDMISPNSIKKCEHYNFMVYFTDLRNCIVHSEGVFYSDMKNTKRLEGLKKLKELALIDFKETKGIKRTRYEIIINEKLFIDESIDKIEHFLREMDEMLQTQY